jgi:hypothetical protein
MRKKRYPPGGKVWHYCKKTKCDQLVNIKEVADGNKMPELSGLRPLRNLQDPVFFSAYTKSAR